MRKILLFFFFLSAAFNLQAQVPEFKLTRTLGMPVIFPRDVAVDQDNFMYILESPTIHKLDSDGVLVQSFKLYENYNTSTGAGVLTVDRWGNMYVSSAVSSGNYMKIRKYNPKGELVLDFGAYGTDPGAFRGIKALDADDAGNVYVADYGNFRVQKFNAQGEFVLAFQIAEFPANSIDNPVAIKVGKSGLVYVLTEDNRVFKINAAGQLTESFRISMPIQPENWPVQREFAMALDDEENIYVSDLTKGTKRVHKFSSSGQFVQSFGSNQASSGIFLGERIGIALNSKGEMVTIDRNPIGPSTIQIFEAAGGFKKLIRCFEPSRHLAMGGGGNYYLLSHAFPRVLIKEVNAFGVTINEFGNSNGDSLISPLAITTDGLGNVYCLESTREWSRIQKFSKEGKFLRKFESFGADMTTNFLSDLAVDSRGNIYVSDYYGGCIRKISPTGNFLGKIASGAAGMDQVSYPRALTLDLKGNIYIADFNGNRLRKFSPEGKAVKEFYAFPPPDYSFDVYLNASVEVDFAGNVFAITGRDNSVRMFNASGKEIGQISLPFNDEANLGDFSINKSGNRLLLIAGRMVWEYLSGHALRENVISGKVYQDKNANCLWDANEMPLAGMVLMAEPGPYYGISDETGSYAIAVDTGSYTLRTLLPQDIGRTILPSCPGASTQVIEIGGYGKVVKGPDFGNQVNNLPLLQVEVASNRRRRCFRNVTRITYANTGFAAAAQAKVTVQLPEYVSFISASISHERDAKGNYVFAVGDLVPNQRGTITLIDSVSCADPQIRGLTVCTNAWITPANTYPAPANWNKAEISVSGRMAEEGQARFVIRNVGTGDMTDSLFFRLYQDADLALQARYHLAAHDSLVLRFRPTGSLVRVEVDQPEGHPLKATAGESVEVRQRLDTSVPSLLMAAYPPDDPEPEIARDCLPIIDSFDPNDKQVLPAGLTSEHFTPTNTPLRYTVRFQNTGTDLAYRVVVVDTLAAELNLSTLQVGAVSHPYRLSVSGKERPVLTFTFDNIMLPDSTRDQAGSNGFVQFSIRPKGQLPEKTPIANYADIFFDYNEPVRTNTTLNRLFDMPREVKKAAQLSLSQVWVKPVITGFSPAQSRAGAVVQLKGRHFGASALHNQVLFNGVAATVLSASDSVLLVQVPAKAFSGNIRVRTHEGEAISKDGFIIFQPPAITALSAAEGVPGTIIHLTGSHFSLVPAQDTVTFDGVPAQVLEASETSIKAVVPQGATWGKVQVKTLGGKAESPQPFRVWYPPMVTALSPGKGRAGAILVLQGQHFAEEPARNTVQFGAVSGEVLEASATLLRVRVPAAAATGKIQLLTPGGSAFTPATFNFIPAPEIASFHPAQANAGETITLSGQHFNAEGLADTVYFNDLPAQVIKASETELVVRAPKGVASGAIRVAGAGGRAAAAGFVVPDLKPEEAITIYPNPTKAGIRVNWFKAGFTLESLRVYNGIGKLVAEMDPGTAENDELELALFRFGPGLYLVHIQTSAGLVVKRVVVL